MQDSLFRSQAVAARRTRLLGDVILRQPLGPCLAALLLAACAVLVVAFLAWGSYARIETVRGVVTPMRRGGPLHVELFVPTRAAGFVRAGQAVWIRYDAFPYQRFGSHQGEIDDVGKATFAGPGPEPFYRASVRLSRQDIAGRPLRPGMLVEAGIALERRTLLGWLLAPLVRARARVLPPARPTGGDCHA